MLFLNLTILHLYALIFIYILDHKTQGMFLKHTFSWYSYQNNKACPHVFYLKECSWSKCCRTLMGSIMNNVARAPYYGTGFIFSNDLWFCRILNSHIVTCIILWKANTVFPRYFKIIYNWLNFRKYCFCSPWGLSGSRAQVQKECLNFFVFTSNNRTVSGFILSKSKTICT